MFNLCDNNPGIFTSLTANTPDVVIDEESIEVSVLERACTFEAEPEGFYDQSH